jgi:hypothetical protein
MSLQCLRLGEDSSCFEIEGFLKGMGIFERILK